MNRAAALKIGFLLAFLLLCAVLSWVGLRLVLPKPDWVEIGRLVDFPSAEHPYEIFSPAHLFVVKNGDQLIVLEPINQIPGGYNVNWNPVEQAFIDPNRGTWFDLLGMPTQRLRGNRPMENQSLPRYPVKIENGQIYFDSNSTQVEKIRGR